jgi:hypothetical protein
MMVTSNRVTVVTVLARLLVTFRILVLLLTFMSRVGFSCYYLLVT